MRLATVWRRAERRWPRSSRGIRMPSSWPTTARAAGMPPITARTARAAYRLLLATILTAAGAAGAPAADAALGFAVPHPVGGTYQEALRHQVIATYALQRRAQYLAIIDGVRQLDAACSALIAHPSPATMAAARSAWIAARLLYAPSECHRFYSGPIDEPRADLENRINAWPIDESYIDYVDGDAGSGIINHVQDYPVIDTRLLIALNRSGGEKNIATGYHAIEFLLWGQGAQARGPGVRSSADYLPHSPVGHADRRAAYLRAALDLLLADLGAVARAWDVQTPGSYGARFVQESSLLSLQHIFVGMAGLSGDELACERMGRAASASRPATI
jgi:putative iron-regulated protein